MKKYLSLSLCAFGIANAPVHRTSDESVIRHCDQSAMGVAIQYRGSTAFRVLRPNQFPDFEIQIYTPVENFKLLDGLTKDGNHQLQCNIAEICRIMHNATEHLNRAVVFVKASECRIWIKIENGCSLFDLGANNNLEKIVGAMKRAAFNFYGPKSSKNSELLKCSEPEILCGMKETILKDLLRFSDDPEEDSSKITVIINR